MYEAGKYDDIKVSYDDSNMRENECGWYASRTPANKLYLITKPIINLY